MHGKISLKFSILPVIFSLLLSACGGGGGGGVANPIASVAPPDPATTAELRLQELDIIDNTLRDNHPDMFFKLNETDWQNQIAQLGAQVEDISPLGFMFESTKMVANIGDQHTYMIMPTELLHQFPFEVWWDEDRAIITRASAEYMEFLGHEVRSIDGTPMVELRESVMQYLASENDYWKVGISPLYLKLAEVMAYEGLIASAESSSVEFVSATGEVSQTEVVNTLGPAELVSIESTMDTSPAYATHIEDNYSVQLVEDDIFIQYVNAFDMFLYPLDSLILDIQNMVANNQIDNIIVDLRFNHGGQIDHFLPVIDYLSETEFNNPEDLFVLTGRNTFSSGVGATYSFLNQTEATFVGMPTGGKPNGFSNVVGLGLPLSGNSLFLAIEYRTITDDDPDTFMPEYLTPFTQADFLSGTDPAIEFINARW